MQSTNYDSQQMWQLSSLIKNTKATSNKSGKTNYDPQL